MPDFPRVTGKDARRAFERHGWELDRYSDRGHAILKKAGFRFHLSIPEHRGKILGKGLLSKLIETAGLTVDEFVEKL